MFSNLRSLIFKLDPEKAHSLAIKSLKFNFVPNLFEDGCLINYNKYVKVQGSNSTWYYINNCTELLRKDSNRRFH